ncbi:unnamed protein product [Ixodes persulcatus]
MFTRHNFTYYSKLACLFLSIVLHRFRSENLERMECPSAAWNFLGVSQTLSLESVQQCSANHHIDRVDYNHVRLKHFISCFSGNDQLAIPCSRTRCSKLLLTLPF